MLLITAPILVPVTRTLGFDMIWFRLVLAPVMAFPSIVTWLPDLVFN